MKNLFFVLLLSLIALTAAAQKIAIKNSVMTVDGQPYARIVADSPGPFGFGNAFYVNSLQNERLFVVKLLTLNDPAAATAENPAGSISYLQFVFTASRTFAETPVPPIGLLNALGVARKLYAAQLLHGGHLDPQAVADFATNNGTLYSEHRQALDQAVLVPVVR